MISVFHRDVPGKSTASRLRAGARGDHRAIRPGLAALYHRYREERTEPLRPDFAAAALSLDFLPDESEAPTEVLGLIVETRRHPNLEPVIVEACEMLGLPVRLICSEANRDHALRGRVGDLVRAGRVRVDVLPDIAFDRDAYNGLFLSPRFWRRFERVGRVLVFQTDVVFCPGSRYALHDFTGFDYIGSMWRAEHRAGLSFAGGNGGLSLRDPRKAIACLEAFPPAEWPASEDKYFAFHLELMGARVATPRDSSRFGSERWFLHRSFGAHNVEVMYATHLADFLAYCPSGQRIMGRKRPEPGRRFRWRMRVNKLLLRAYLRLRWGLRASIRAAQSQPAIIPPACASQARSPATSHQ